MLFGFGILVLVMVLSGLLGGTVNHFMAGERAEKEAAGEGAKKPRISTSWQRSVLIGIAAAFVVPVFLQLAAVGSEGSLVKTFLKAFAGGGGDLDAEAYDSLTVIAGFCIVAAIASRSFLSSVSEKLLQRATDQAETAVDVARGASSRAGLVEEGLDETRQLQQGLTRMIEMQDALIERLSSGNAPEAQSIEEEATTEDDQPGDDDEDSGPATVPQSVTREGAERPAPAANAGTARPGISDVERRVLNALAAKPSVRRSIKGIRTDDPGLSRAQVSKALKDLHGRGYVRRLSPIDRNSQFPRWKLAPLGWSVIEDN